MPQQHRMLKPLTLVLMLAGSFAAVPDRRPQTGSGQHPAFAGRWLPVNGLTRPYLGAGMWLMRIAAIDFTAPNVLTIEYSAQEFTATRTIKLGDSDTEPSIVFVTAPGMSGPVRSNSATRSLSRATWLKNKLRVVTKLTVPWGGKTSTTDIRDDLSLDADGSLVVETLPSSGGGTFRSRFTRTTESSDTTTAAPAIPLVPAKEHEWLDGYRFGMSSAEVRRVAVCPARDYLQSTGGSERFSMLCQRFPFRDLLVQATFGFQHDSLTAITLRAFPNSAKDAHLAAEVFLSYLNVEGGILSSVELGSRPVTAAAIWDDLDHRPKSRYPERVNVATAGTSLPVVLTATFSKGPYVIQLAIADPR